MSVLTPVSVPAMGAQARSQQGEPPSDAQLLAWLEEVPDPEIPVISIVDLGIVRAVEWNEVEQAANVVITPPYSGCPATDVIGGQIREHRRSVGVERVHIRTQLAPAWTTDWMTERGRKNLLEYGIAPPTERAVAPGNGLASSLVVLGQGAHKPALSCPRCGSTQTELLSRFGSTPCKSLHRCLSCAEPFDHFKCH